MRWLPTPIERRLGDWITALVSAKESDLQMRRNQVLMSQLRHCGIGVHFNGTVIITHPEHTSIASNVHIGNNAFLGTRGGLSIGENTHIARNLVAHTSNHQYLGRRLPYDDEHVMKPVVIGRNVWIGANVVVVPGISIGDGAIVGAGCVVNTDIPSLAIVGSQPIRVLKYRDANHYTNLDEKRLYGGISGRSIKEDNDIGTEEDRLATERIPAAKTGYTCVEHAWPHALASEDSCGHRRSGAR